MSQPLTSACPWDFLSPSSFPVCEESLCAWIKQPANTFSNIGFFLVAAFLFWRQSKTRSQDDLILGLCAILVGVCSGIAHASTRRIFGYFDFAAIFSLFSYVASRDLRILYSSARFRKAIGFFPVFIFSLLGLYIFEQAKVIFFILFFMLLIFLEYQVHAKHKGISRSLVAIFICFTLGGAAIFLDASRIVCDPKNHFFQLHMVWHLIMALNIYFLANHLRDTRARPHTI